MSWQKKLWIVAFVAVAVGGSVLLAGVPREVERRAQAVSAYLPAVRAMTGQAQAKAMALYSACDGVSFAPLEQAVEALPPLQTCNTDASGCYEMLTVRHTVEQLRKQQLVELKGYAEQAAFSWARWNGDLQEDVLMLHVYSFVATAVAVILGHAFAVASDKTWLYPILVLGWGIPVAVGWMFLEDDVRIQVWVKAELRLIHEAERHTSRLFHFLLPSPPFFRTVDTNRTWGNETQLALDHLFHAYRQLESLGEQVGALRDGEKERMHLVHAWAADLEALENAVWRCMGTCLGVVALLVVLQFWARPAERARHATPQLLPPSAPTPPSSPEERPAPSPDPPSSSSPPVVLEEEEQTFSFPQPVVVSSSHSLPSPSSPIHFLPPQ